MNRFLAVLFAWGALVLPGCSPGGTGSSQPSPDPVSLQQAFVGAVDRAVPAVVNIRTVTRYPLGGFPGYRSGREEIQDYLLDMLEEDGGYRENSLGRALPGIDLPTTGIALLTLTTLVLGNRMFARVPFLKRVPAPLIAMLWLTSCATGNVDKAARSAVRLTSPNNHSTALATGPYAITNQ